MANITMPTIKWDCTNYIKVIYVKEKRAAIWDYNLPAIIYLILGDGSGSGKLPNSVSGNSSLSIQHHWPRVSYPHVKWSFPDLVSSFTWLMTAADVKWKLLKRWKGEQRGGRAVVIINRISSLLPATAGKQNRRELLPLSPVSAFTSSGAALMSAQLVDCAPLLMKSLHEMKKEKKRKKEKKKTNKAVNVLHVYTVCASIDCHKSASASPRHWLTGWVDEDATAKPSSRRWKGFMSFLLLKPFIHLKKY